MNILISLSGVIIIIASIALLVITNMQYKEQKKKEKKKNSDKKNTDEAKDLNKQNRNRHIGRNAAVGLGILLGLALMVASESFVIIPTGYTGVKICLGQIDDKTLGTGANFKKPFIETVEKVNNKQQDISFDKKIWSETKGRTALYYKDVTVTYQINPEKSSWIYANVTNYKDSLLNHDLIASAVKASSKTLEDADATNRSIVEPLINENIEKSVKAKYGSDVVYIIKVTVSDIDFEKSYNQAISEKQKAQIEAEKQAIENQKKIEQAEAEAKATEIKAQAEAKANELKQESLSDEILRNRAIEKWDGTLPKACGQDLNFILDMFGEGQTSNENNQSK